MAGRVALRVLPNVRIRSFSLEGGRIVAIDVFGGTAAQALAPSAPDPEQEAILELRQALEQRDAAIESLLARVEQLERIVALPSGNLDRVTAGRAVATPSLGDMPPPRLASPPGAAIEAPSSEPSGTSPAARSTRRTPEHQPATIGQSQDVESSGVRARQETAQGEAPAPGQVEVDEEAVERALDFTLVQEGAPCCCLPAEPRSRPASRYTRRTNDFPTIVNEETCWASARCVATSSISSGACRSGFPFDSQLELGLPYNLVDQSTTDRVGGGGFREQSDTGYGLGDFSVGLAKTVLREERWWPDVILRANWDSGTGERQNNDVVLDGGFQDLTGSLSLTKRQDPLVFVGGAFYEWTYDETDDIDPGINLASAPARSSLPAQTPPSVWCSIKASSTSSRSAARESTAPTGSKASCRSAPRPSSDATCYCLAPSGWV